MAGYKQTSSAPTRKVSAGAVGGAISAVIVWVVNQFVLPPDSQIPAAVVAAITTIISALIAYSIPPAPEDTITPVTPVT
jgi:hypothetical protein